MTNVDRLTANPPPEQPHQIGHEEGDTCGRYPEEDEDQPRGYRPKPCQGVMEMAPVQNCYCHIDAPCSRCVENGVECSVCGHDTSPFYDDYEPEHQRPRPDVNRRNETTSTHTDGQFNSTPFTKCCGVAAINVDRCPACEAQIEYHDDGLAARRREVGAGNCLMCGKKRGPIEVLGNCCC
jgi:hypothetical protein